MQPQGCCTGIGGRRRQSQVGSTFLPGPGWRSGESLTREVAPLGQVRLHNLCASGSLGRNRGLLEVRDGAGPAACLPPFGVEPGPRSSGNHWGCWGWPPESDSTRPRAGTWLGAVILQPAGGRASAVCVLLFLEGSGPVGWTAPCLNTGNCTTKEDGKALKSAGSQTAWQNAVVKSACSGAGSSSGALTYLLFDLSVTFSWVICKMRVILVPPSLGCCYE